MDRVVTVGLDGSPESESAAHWAAREAGLRKLPLRLVHAWIMMPHEAGTEAAEVQSYWPKHILGDVQTLLTERYPQVPISADLLSQDPTEALLTAAKES